MSIGDETDNYEAFDRLTEALEHLDAYQQTKSPEALKEADHVLSQAREDDSKYLRVGFVQSLTAYLRGGNEETMIGDLKGMLEKLRESNNANGSLANELRYNLAVAYYEARQAGKNLDNAIQEFELIIENTVSDDLILDLLACAGVALAYAQKAFRNKGTDTESRTKSLTQCNYVESKLRRDDLRALFFLRRKIDEQLTAEIRGIINEARHKIAKSKPNNPKPTNQSDPKVPIGAS